MHVHHNSSRASRCAQPRPLAMISKRLHRGPVLGRSHGRAHGRARRLLLENRPGCCGWGTPRAGAKQPTPKRRTDAFKVPHPLQVLPPGAFPCQVSLPLHLRLLLLLLPPFFLELQVCICFAPQPCSTNATGGRARKRGGFFVVGSLRHANSKVRGSFLLSKRSLCPELFLTE